jgi:sugar phosphate isomerase/epimerase
MCTKMLRTIRLAALLLCGVPFAGLAQNMPPVGLELYSLRDQFPKDVPGTMAKVKAMGIKYVEVAGTYGLSDAAFKKLLDANGLKAIGTSGEFDQLQKDVKPIIQNAKALGAKYVVCFWIPHNGDEFTLEDVKKAVTVFNKAGKELKANGLSLAYHPHGYEFRPHEGGTLFDYLVKNLDPQYVNFEMDVFWVKHPGQDPVALLKKYPAALNSCTSKTASGHGGQPERQGRRGDQRGAGPGRRGHCRHCEAGQKGRRGVHVYRRRVVPLRKADSAEPGFPQNGYVAVQTPERSLKAFRVLAISGIHLLAFIE